MRVLVTGGAGYIGSHTVALLRERGHEPIVFDNLSTGHADAVGPSKLIVGDLLHRGAIGGTMVDHQPDAVMHFASLAIVSDSVKAPGRYYQRNLIGAMNLLDVMPPARKTPIVFSSSCATYGEPMTELIDENHPQNPINPYGETKLTIERMIKSYSHAYGMPYSILRYFNAAGAAWGLGERHDPETHLIPSVLRAALVDQPVPVYGTDHPTPDGTCIRDYVHVEDLAEAHVLSLEHLSRGGASHAVNLGSGVGRSVEEVILAAQTVTGKTINCEARTRREGDPPRLVAAVGAARDLLGWEPKRTLADAVASAWEFHKEMALGNV